MGQAQLKIVPKSKLVELSLTHTDMPKLRHAWPWKSGSVDSVQVVNLVQFYTPDERIHFANELCRVLKAGAKAQISTPHWCSARAYGDLAFQYPPVSEGWFYHLNKDWRLANAPWGKAYTCDFDITFGYGLHPLIINRNTEYQQHAVTFFKESAQDIIVTLMKK